MDKILQKISNLSNLCYKMEWLGLLAVRFFIFQAFFKSGFARLNDLKNTEYLYTADIHVPFIAPKVASLIGTGLEVGLPILLLVGIAGRIPAILLFFFNVALIVWQSSLWTGTADALCALHSSMHFGLMILILIIYGTGDASLDKLIQTTKPNYRF